MKRASALAMLMSSGVVAGACNAVFGVTAGELDPNACVADPDCDDDNPCTLDTCLEKSCVILPVPNLTVPDALQLPGDCLLLRCGDGGVVESINDDSDVPADGSECTLEACVSGELVSELATPGDACSGGKCDFEGVCVACLSVADCPDDTLCTEWICTAGQCSPTHEPDGYELPFDVGGDCKKTVCDGLGGQRIAADPTDPFVDGNECTLDLCNGTEPDNGQFAMNGAGCGSGMTTNCQGGVCTGCQSDDECGADTTCMDFLCQPNQDCAAVPQNAGDVLPEDQQTPQDCLLKVCNSLGGVDDIPDADPLPDGKECTDDVCQMGGQFYQPWLFNTPCNDGDDVCDAAGSCVDCNSPAQCDPPDKECDEAVCNAQTCGSVHRPDGELLTLQNPGDCRQRVCDGMGNVEEQRDDGDVPNDSNPCTLDGCSAGNPYHLPYPINTPCPGGFCNGPPKQCVQCTMDAHCPGACCDESIWMCGVTMGSGGSGVCGVMSSGT